MKLGTNQSDLEEHLAGQLRFRRWIPPPLRQYRVLGHRKYVWDFAWPAHKLAVEIDGGTWTGGAHVRGNGYERDCEKQNLAVLAGWRTMRFTAHQVRSDMAVEMIARALGVEGCSGPKGAAMSPNTDSGERYPWDCPHCTHHENCDSLGVADLTYSHHLWVEHAIRRAEQPIPLEDVIPMTPDQVAWVRASRGARPIDRSGAP